MKCGAWKSLMRQADRVLICDPGSYFVTRVAPGNGGHVPGVRSHGSLRQRQQPTAAPTAQQMAQICPDRPRPFHAAAPAAPSSC